MNRLKEKYLQVIVPEIMQSAQFENVMQIPKIEKIIINCGVGDAVATPKLIDEVVEQLTKISGQKPIIMKAKKSIATFKLREGMPIGVKVTLRQTKMYDFLDKLISISLPQIRDFQGISNNSFDGKGNYTLGIKELIIFPEISFEEVKKIHGCQITIVTSAKTNKDAFLLLSKVGLPFKRKDFK